MCIAILSTAHPEYPYILLSNRDEFLSRPTAPAEWWSPPNQHVLAGRDLQRTEHGTWLGITKQGRLAVLTNFREEGVEVARDKSRGGIVNAFLAGSPDHDHRGESPREFAKRLINDVGVHDVGGFSLAFGELRAPAHDGSRSGLSILSNRSASEDSLTTIASTPGEVHGLSNSHFGDMSWPKVVHGEQMLRQAIHSNVASGESQEHLLESCFDVLCIDTLPKRKEGETWEVFARQLRNSIFIPPVSGSAVDKKSGDQIASATAGDDDSQEKAEHVAASIDSGSYGTTQQTVVLVSKDGKVTFVERTLFDENHRPSTDGQRERRYEFTIDGWETQAR